MMNQQCPQCQNPMLQATSGWMCPSCGHSIHYAFNPQSQNPQPDTNLPSPGQSNHASGPDNSDEVQQDNEPAHQPIINHHASSQYRKRLQEINSRLTEPELSPPDDPELMPIDRPMLPKAQPTESSTPDTPGPIEESDSSPTRPTPMSASVLDLRHAHETQSSALHQTPSAPPRAPKQLDRESAILQAEALLSSSKAISTPTNPARLRIILYAIASTFLIAIALWMLFFITRPISPKATPSVTTSPTASPSAQTESQTRDKRRKADLNNIAAGLAAYKKATGTYPVGEDISVLTILTEAEPAYIKTVPTDPLSSESTIIKYGYTSNGTSFSLSAALENKQDPDAKNGLYILK
ncbi:hypothetical protein KBC99_01085 [Candidatus Saccharibacteria bacterium]|nr:hypothetical protein [Candidatus Saccharibacteria bacterium]